MVGSTLPIVTMQKKVYNYAINVRHVLVLILDGENNTIGGDKQSYLYIDYNVSIGNNNDGDNKIRGIIINRGCARVMDKELAKEQESEA